MKKPILIALGILMYFGVSAQQPIAGGTLKAQGRYFVNEAGEAVYLTGLHTWDCIQDIFLENNRKPFDYEGYIKYMVDRNLNFTRLWTYEHRYGMSYSADRIIIEPHPYKVLKMDDKKQAVSYDLNQWNEDYFNRLKQRIEIANKNGIYVSVMFFQGWSLNKTGGGTSDPFRSNYMNPNNNIQKIGAVSGKVDSDTEPTVHSLMNPELLNVQLKYVDKLIATVNQYDNVIYEILNEGGAIDWTYFMINYIHQRERSMPKQHPVGMTHRVSPRMLNIDLENSPADWISPADEPMDWMYAGSSYLTDLRHQVARNKSNKVSILDTDHLWGCGGNYEWAWKAFLQGHNPIFMDIWDGLLGADTVRVKWMAPCLYPKEYKPYKLLRSNLGMTRKVAKMVDILKSSPAPELVSTGYCLAHPDQSYIVWCDAGKNTTINLLGTSGKFEVTWFDPETLAFAKGEIIEGNDYQVLKPHFTGNSIAVIKKVIGRQ